MSSLLVLKPGDRLLAKRETPMISQEIRADQVEEPARLWQQTLLLQVLEAIHAGQFGYHQRIMPWWDFEELRDHPAGQALSLFPRHRTLAALWPAVSLTLLRSLT